MLLCAVVPSLMHDYNCGVTCIVQCPAANKPLSNLKGFSSLATPVTMRIRLQSFSSTVTTHTHTHMHIHMPVSCLRLPSKSDSLLPAFLSRPHCMTTRDSATARTGPPAFGSVIRPAGRTWGEVRLTRNQFKLLTGSWAAGRVNGYNRTGQRSLRRNQAGGGGDFFHWILPFCPESTAPLFSILVIFT